VVVNPVNDLPRAVDQTVTLKEDHRAEVRLTGSDAEGDPFTFEILSQPVNGVLKSFTRGTCTAAAGCFFYVPNENLNGEDSFTFHACDSSGNCFESATVSLNITAVSDRPPVTVPGTAPRSLAR
jgi:hypothetical protein